jgi:CHASE3 domain sensor protein
MTQCDTVQCFLAISTSLVSYVVLYLQLLYRIEQSIREHERAEEVPDNFDSPPLVSSRMTAASLVLVRSYILFNTETHSYPIPALIFFL